MSDRAPQLFGDILRRERERLGLTIAQANAATRVREQILVAFEESDMENLPPRGYARNMIGSYARWLGLDPRKIIDIYENNLAEWQDQNHSFEDDPYSNYGAAVNRTSNKNRSSANQRRRTSVNKVQTAGIRRSYDTYGADDPDARRNDPAYSRRTASRVSRVSGGYDRNGHSPRSKRIFSGSDYSRGGANNQGRGKIIIIIIAAVLIIILGIVLASSVRSCRANQEPAQNPTAVNTTPVTQDDGTTGTTSTDTTTTEPVTVTLSIAEGATSQVTVQVDGSPQIDNQTLIGPYTQAFTATTQVAITYTDAEAVTVEYAVGSGEAAPVPAADNGDGTFVASVTMRGDGTVSTS